MNPHGDFEPPLEAEAAGLENQLLLLEVQVARGRLRNAEQELTRLRSASKKAFAPEGSVVLDEQHYRDLREAHSNLRWLLRRLGQPPFGWLLRRKAGYRALEQRWISDP